MMNAQRTRSEPERAGISARVVVYPQGGEPEITEAAAAGARSAAAKFTRIVMEKVRESDEAYLSAEPSQASEDPRFSQAHELCRGTPGDRRPPPPGAQAPGRVTGAP